MIRLVYSPCPGEDCAREIAAKLLEERLVACVNILPGVRSLYRWEGKLCDETECVLLAKTREELASQVQARIAALHPYDCPCVITLPVTDAHPPFTQWITDETS
ncbi:MAG: periplasmic divalent cation tolerance protein [Rhodothermales bacterium]|jgi:periplasmic divalent cation tolerance protein